MPSCAGARFAALFGAVHAAGLVAALAITRGAGLGGRPPVEAALPGFAALLAAALIGAALGWRMRRPIAAPIAALVVFALLAIVAEASAEVLYAPGLSEAVGLAVDRTFVVASVAAFALLGTLAVCVGVATSARGHTGAAAAAVGLVVLVGLAPGGRTRPDGGAAACDGRAPAVCAYSERRAWLPATRTEILALQRELAKLTPGVSLPERYSELARSSSRTVALLEVADPADRAALSRDVAELLVRCSDGSISGHVALTIARGAFKPADVPEASRFGLLQPAPLLRPGRVREEALREVRRTRGGWC